MYVIIGSLHQTREAAPLCESLDVNYNWLKQFKYFVSSATVNFTGSKSPVVSRLDTLALCKQGTHRTLPLQICSSSSESEWAQQQYHSANRNTSEKQTPVGCSRLTLWLLAAISQSRKGTTFHTSNKRQNKVRLMDQHRVWVTMKCNTALANRKARELLLLRNPVTTLLPVLIPLTNTHTQYHFP